MNILRGHALVACLVASAPLPAQQIPVIEKTLSNGMRVLMVERPGEPTISVGWVVRAGSVNERPGGTGIAHLFEHMMFKGTKRIGTKDAVRDAQLNEAQDRVQAQIRQELDLLREQERRGEIADMMDPKARSPRLQQLTAEFDGLVNQQRELIVNNELMSWYDKEGARGMNANTTNDRTYYFIQVPSNKLELWAWLESDRLHSPVFREFYTEREVVLEERRQRIESTPTGTVAESFEAMVWQAHPYSWPVMGWISDISQVTREQANAFFATYYAPNNLTAVLVGDFKATEALPLLERYFGRIPANPNGVPKVITAEPPQPAEQRMHAEVHATPSVEVAIKSVPIVHKDSPALEVLAAALNGQSGRLQKELVLNRKLATGAMASTRGMKYGGVFYLMGMPAPGRSPEEVEPLLYAEIEKIAKEGITDRELQKVKNQLQAGAFAALESNDTIRDALAEADAMGSYKDFQTLPARLEAVTHEDIKRVAATYFRKENRNVAVLRRKGGAVPPAAVAQVGAAPAAQPAVGTVDPDFERIPAEYRDAVAANVAKMEGMSRDQLAKGLERMQGQEGQVPAEQRPMFDYVVKKLREHIAKAPAAPVVDPDFEKIPAIYREAATNYAATIARMPKDELAREFAQMQSRESKTPPEEKPMFDYLVKKFREAIAKQEGK